jgi:hypothetical protein
MADQEPDCEIDPESVMSYQDFSIKLLSTSYKKAIQGFYHSEQPVISDECFGEWMVPKSEQFNNFVLELYSDPMSTSIEEARLAADNFVDLHYINRDSCQIKKLTDDYYNWCLNNLDMCAGYDEGFYTRLYQNGQEMFAAFYDLAGIWFFENDLCYTDAQLIDEVGRITQDLSALASYLIGFDLDFDLERKQRHIRKYDFWTQVNEYVDSLYEQYYYPVFGDEEYWGFDEDYFFIDEDSLFTFDDYLYDMEFPTYEVPEVPVFELPEYPAFPTW